MTPTRLQDGVIRPANLEILMYGVGKHEDLDWVWKVLLSYCCTVQTHLYLASLHQARKKSDPQALRK